MLTVFGAEADVSEWQGGERKMWPLDMERSWVGGWGDLLEDEGTERDKEPEMESKQTEMWQVWKQSWVSRNMENGAHPKEKGNSSAPSLSASLPALQLHVSHLSSVSPFLPLKHSTSPHLSPRQRVLSSAARNCFPLNQ